MRKERVILTLGVILSTFLLVIKADEIIQFSSLIFVVSPYSFSFLDGSGALQFTSAILGYLIFLIFISDFWIKAKNIPKALLISFVLLASTGFIVELFNIIECLAGSPNGRHLRIGLPLGIFGFYLVGLHQKRSAINDEEFA